MAEYNKIQEALLEKANTLPLSSGVYVMRDAAGKVIYVGKSRKLKHRVSQYFQNSQKNIKTAKMVSLVRDFDYFVCDNEMEALSLENTLIKQYSPKYNIRLKDAKSYPYIKIGEGEYPRLTFTRKRDNDKAKYFGPYSGAGKAYALIELLNKTLNLPTCSRKFPRDIGKERPCIYYQMKRCCGVCTGNVTPEEYGNSIRYAVDLLGGKDKEVEKRLQAEMLEHAEAERYEAAAKCRDTIEALRSVAQKQKVVASPDTEQDVIALYADDVCACVSVFYIRGGVLQDKSDFLYGADSILEPEDMTTFLCEHYKKRTFIPHTVLLAYPCEPEDLTVLSEYLSKMAGYRVTVREPMRGQLRTLCDMVEKNAAEQAKLYRINSERQDGTLYRLAELLGLECYPTRIEAYDISNLGKEHLTAGMIVCRDGKFSKSDYRTFSIKSVIDTTDDYASMREALARRLAHLSDEGNSSFSELPDLILLDGGRGHVGVIRALLSELELDLPVFGMVKDDFHKTRALCTDTQEISIAKEQDVFTFIYKIQEEVHRYTVGRMSSAKRKTLKTSSLSKIPGIGEKKAKKLLLGMGSLRAVQNADVEALAAISGIGQKDAVAVYTYFHPSKEKGEETT